MKKYLWIVALLAALAMVFVGCDSGGGGGTGTGGGDEVEGTYVEEFVLSKYLKELVDAGTLTTGVEINTTANTTGTGALKNLKFVLAGKPADDPTEPHLKAKIVQNGDKLALEFETIAVWGAGFDLLDSGIKFQAKDKVKFSGRILADFGPAPNSWATPVLYLSTNWSDDMDRPAVTNDLKAGTAYEKELLLDANDIRNIAKTETKAIRIGARPGESKFTVDEVIVQRFVPAVATPKYTATYYDTNKTTVVGTVANIESGSFLMAPTTSDAWFATFLANLPAGKMFDAWFKNPGDTAWDFDADKVTANVSLYAVLADIPNPPTFFADWGPPIPSGGETWWGTDTADASPVAAITVDIFKASTYLIVKGTLNHDDGVGGCQFGLQSDGDGWGWNQFNSGNWTNKPAGTENGDTIYLVYYLPSTSFYSTAITSATQSGKIKANSIAGSFVITNVYLADGYIEMPADGVAFNSSDCQGFATAEVPGLDD